MKKAYISPVTSLLMSLSLALGILVGNLNGYSLLTRAHAQEGGTCGGQGGTATIVSDLVNIEDGLILSGLTARNITVNGTFMEQAVIVGSVKVINATVKDSTNIIEVSGVLIGSGSPTTQGVLIGSGSPTTQGVLIGSGSPTPEGVLIGSGSPCSDVTPVVSGVTGEASGTAVGGALTGDDIVISDGFISGHNLLLSGATIDRGAISGTITSVRLTPAD